jgi:hypothetical protein
MRNVSSVSVKEQDDRLCVTGDEPAMDCHSIRALKIDILIFHPIIRRKARKSPFRIENKSSFEESHLADFSLEICNILTPDLPINNKMLE